ncbi:replication initiator protein A [Acutalibacter sp. LFL-21]|uniref:replication initiator protein A n=1 Tax=Acutalibacter sp. LFL-21 TaxID=2983399 RepID=UPI0021D6594D|nr:replication initiator protein A [Acutalibacter sp. LFL-21]MCU7653297.1 replication initiator protein A [Acutalibacter sp. LFL-21]
MQKFQPARQLPRIKPRQALQYRYLVIPQLLITDPAFADIDCAAKLTYAILLNRLTLSAENPAEYTDEEGQLFVIFTVEELQSTLHLSKPTAVKVLNQLEKAGLIEKKRQGQGKPTLLYVNDFTAAVELPSPGGDSNGPESDQSTVEDSSEKLNDLTSRSEEFEPQEVKKLDCSKNDLRKNDLRISSSYQDEERKDREARALGPPHVRKIDIDDLTEDVKNQIEYDVLKEVHGECVAKSVLFLIVGVLARDGPFYFEKGQYPEEAVKQRFRSLEYMDIDRALNILYQTPGVRNQTAYLQTLLFNAVGSSDIEAAALWEQNENQREKNRN